MIKQQRWQWFTRFTIELFFIFSETTPIDTLITQIKHVLYIGTFEVITFDYESMHSLGTQQILLNLVCDLITSMRTSPNFPEPITTMLVDVSA